MSNELVKASTVSVPAMHAVASLPELVERAGGAARFAWEATPAYTACRAGAFARLRLGDFQHDVGLYVLRFHPVKRRLKDAGLPSGLSPHSFRVTAITDPLSQGILPEDVQ